MKDIEINVKLALVIGWKSEQIEPMLEQHCVNICTAAATLTKPAAWCCFDFKDPAVIWPIAERYNIWPSRIIDGHNKGLWFSHGGLHAVTCDTAAKSVALAVIANYENEAS